MLSAAEYGTFSFFASLSLVISIFALFGFQNSSVKFISTFGLDGTKRGQTKNFMNFARGFTLILAIGAATLTYGALFLFGFADKYPVYAFGIGFLLVPLMVWVRLHAAFLRGFSKSALSIFYETSLREILFLAILLGAITVGASFDLGIYALVVLTCALLFSGIAAWINTWFVFRGVRAETDRTERKAIRKEWVQTSFPMMLIIFAQRFLRRSDVIILGLMVHPALVGAYAIAAQFSEVGSIGQKGIFSVFSPRAAKLYKAESHDGLKRLYRTMTIYGVITTGAMCLGIAVLAPYALSFFGEDYGVGYRALLILLVGQFLNVCFGPVGVLMIMTQYEKMAMKLTMIAAAGNLILNPFAIIYFGLEGAAMTTAFFLITRAMLSYLYVKKQEVI